ncbi:MAG: hypothetical protein ABSE08_14855 [Syntrophobacteraceae bacterium]|jgi:hypothetical protein
MQCLLPLQKLGRLFSPNFADYLTDEFFNVLDERLGEASNSSLSIRA